MTLCLCVKLTLLKLSWPERDSISLTSSIKVGKRIELIKRKWKPTLRFSEGKSPAISGETAKHRMRGEDERNKELFT